jgi:DNA-binding transcriptional MerR regulator
VATHVLRFWETKFSQIKPMKADKGRRYYRPDDVEIIKLIKDLLYNKRYTIEGVQKLLKDKGTKAILGGEIQKDFFEPETKEETTEPLVVEKQVEVLALSAHQKDVLRQAKDNLLHVSEDLKKLIA